MYAEFAHDPKVQMMTEAMQRRYMMLMCMRCSNTLVTLHDDEVAFHLRISVTELAETKQLFVNKGFIDDSWDLLNWEKRQFASDRSAPRVAKHRALQKKKQKEQGDDDVTLQKQKSNALDTDTDTDTDTDIKDTTRAQPTRAGAVCVVVKAAGISSANPQHPKLLELLANGAQVQEFESAARKAVEAGKGFAYTLGIVKNSRDDAKRQPSSRPASGETFRERDARLARERMQDLLPSIAAKAPRSRDVIDITPGNQNNFGALA